MSEHSGRLTKSDSKSSLERNLKNIVTNLLHVVADHSALAWKELRPLLGQLITTLPDEQGMLRAGLERVLADPSYLQVYLEFLDGFPRVGWEWCCDDLGEDRIQVVMENGLHVLAPEELTVLALSPYQLCSVRDEIQDSFPEYWADAVEKAMEQTANETGQRRQPTQEIAQKVWARLAQVRVGPSEPAKAHDVLFSWEPSYALAAHSIGSHWTHGKSEDGTIWWTKETDQEGAQILRVGATLTHEGESIELLAGDTRLVGVLRRLTEFPDQVGAEPLVLPADAPFVLKLARVASQ
jgi:hypothetical protein